MGEQRTDNDDLPAETKGSRNQWRNYQERVRADGGVSRFINPTISGKQRWIQIPDQPKIHLLAPLRKGIIRSAKHHQYTRG